MGTMHYNVRIGTVSEALQVESNIPEFDRKKTEQDFFKKLHKVNHLILVAEVNANLVGYKVGYALSDTDFYSWLGGVIPEYRKLGIASALRVFQESWAFDQGYHSICVSSYNKFSSMLKMLITSGYQISDFEKHENIEECKIKFTKKLAALTVN